MDQEATLPSAVTVAVSALYWIIPFVILNFLFSSYCKLDDDWNEIPARMILMAGF